MSPLLREVEQLRRFIGINEGGLEVCELRAGTTQGDVELRRQLESGALRTGSVQTLVEELLTEKSNLIQRWKLLEVAGAARRLGEADDQSLSKLHSEGYGFWGRPVTSSYAELGIDSEEFLGKRTNGVCSLLLLAITGLGSNGGEVDIA